jgi:hypothetical protein
MNVEGKSCLEFVEQAGVSKQRLRLSAYAWSIIEQDRMSFSYDGEAVSKAGLLNRIFLNFYEHAEASIPLRLEEKVNEWINILKTSENESYRALIEDLANGYKSELQLKIKDLCSQGASDLAWNLTLQVDTCKLLIDLWNRNFFSIEPAAKITRGKFLIAVFEEYAKKPYVEREQIYFMETFINIKDAILHERPIIITYAQTDKPLHVLPHSLETDKLSMYNYLIGYARSAVSFSDTADDKNFSLQSFRLSKIQRVEIDRHQKAGSGKLNSEQCDRIQKSRAWHGTMFIADDDKIYEIVVRLTDDGKRKYINQVHMRPSQYIDGKQNKRENNDIFVFKCTLHQAKAYFFKFGSDAEILSPLSLREQFKQEYIKSVALYK